MEDKIQDKYNQLLEQHGYSNQSLGWGQKERSHLRFHILCAYWNLNHARILDFGCGFGGLKDYLTRQQVSSFVYHGVDINASFIEMAQQRNHDTECKYSCRDIFINPFKDEEFDYSFVSGTLNDYREDHYGFYEKVLSELYRISKKGLALNFLSDSAEIRYPHASYFNPVESLKIASKFSKNIILRCDYMPYEFSIIINKNRSINTELSVYEEFTAFV